MAPKAKFTKEQIIAIAFEIAREEGLEGLTLRKVAEKLGSSVAPIYVNFNDASDLIKEVVLKAQRIAIEMSKENYTTMPFLNIGIGILRFAGEYSRIFTSLTLLKIDKLQEDFFAKDVMLEQMKQDDLLKGFSEEQLSEIYLKMIVFTQGLCIMAANQLLPLDLDEKKMIELITNTGEDVILATKLKKDGYCKKNLGDV